MELYDMTKGKVVLLVEPSGSEMLFALVCSLLGISVYSRPPYMTAGCCLHATPGCTLFSSLKICSCREGGMVHRPHIRQPCSTESSSLRSKNHLSAGVVQKWVGQTLWVIASTGFWTVWRAVSKTEKCVCLLAPLTPGRFGLDAGILPVLRW